MTECNQGVLGFGRVQRRRIEAEFSGGEITSDGGVVLLRQADRRIGLIEQMARALSDARRQASCDHRLTTLLRQRVFGLALGYEDVNDHDQASPFRSRQYAGLRLKWATAKTTISPGSTR